VRTFGSERKKSNIQGSIEDVRMPSSISAHRLPLQLELEHDARQLVVVLVIELHVHFVVAL